MLRRRRDRIRDLARPGESPHADTPDPPEASGGTGSGAGHDTGPRGSIVTIDDTTFYDATAGGFTLVDFWAPWCAPCRSFSPMFRDLAGEHASETIRFGSCNVDESPSTAALLQIGSIPTVVVFDRDGNEATRLVGLRPRADFEAVVARIHEVVDQMHEVADDPA